MYTTYEINRDTLAIIPIDEKTSKVIEKGQEIIVERKAMDIIDDSCRYFGSSYTGRFEGTKKILGVNYKSPIIIEESRGIIFFPTSSPRFPNCSWVCLNNIEDYQKSEKGTSVYFINGQTINLNISHSSFENQMIRSLRLAKILKRRKMI